MSIISCPECQNEISDKTKTCPKCGFPVKKTEIINKFKVKVKHTTQNIRNIIANFTDSTIFFVLVMILVMIVGTAIIVGIMAALNWLLASSNASPGLIWLIIGILLIPASYFMLKWSKVPTGLAVTIAIICCICIIYSLSLAIQM